MDHGTQPSGGAAEGAQMARQHIFVVNGDPDFLGIIRELLQGEEYNVTTTNYVPATFDQIAALVPSVLLVDLVYGQRAGWDLLERLHREAQTRGIPVVIFSTAPKELDAARRDPARYGGNAFIAKPFDLDDLLTTIRGLIGPA